MATRSYILRQKSDESYEGIYCHFDGYPEHNGRILDIHYTNPEIVRTLLNLGSISYLDVTPSLCECIDSDQFVFFETKKELMKCISTIVEYIYVFLPDNKWEILSNSKNLKLSKTQLVTRS